MSSKRKKIALRSLIAGAALVGLLAAASPALASTASLTSAGVEYTAAPGEANDVTTSPSSVIVGGCWFCNPATTMDITDPGAFSITPIWWDLDSYGCDWHNPFRPSAVWCAVVVGTRVTISAALGDRDDRFSTTFGGSLGIAVDGGPGNDQLSGSWRGDVLLGSEGNDVLDGSTGTDVLDGGADTDTVDYSASGVSPVTVTMDDSSANDGRPGENDALVNVENVTGSTYGGDQLFGAGGANVLKGLGGNDDISGRGGNDVIEGSDGYDRLKGGAGYDQLLGGPEDDEIVSRDGELDHVDCGPGIDSVYADRAELFLGEVINCEFVSRFGFAWDTPAF